MGLSGLPQNQMPALTLEGPTPSTQLQGRPSTQLVGKDVWEQLLSETDVPAAGPSESSLDTLAAGPSYSDLNDHNLLGGYKRPRAATSLSSTGVPPAVSAPHSANARLFWASTHELSRTHDI